MTASGNHHGLVVPPSFFIKNYGDARQAESMAKPITDPLGSITGVDSTALVSVPFISTYHGRGENTAVDEPLGTQTTRDRHALVEPAAMVDDCGFRMLEPHEVGRAMAFPDGYPVRGTKRDKVKLYGNAVTPPAMTTVSQRGLASVA